MAWLWNKHVNEIPDFIINEEIHQKNILQIIWGFIVFEGYRLAVDIPNAMRLTSKMPWTANCCTDFEGNCFSRHYTDPRASCIRFLYSPISNIVVIKMIMISFKGKANHTPRTLPFSKRGNTNTKGTTSANCLNMTTIPACFAFPIDWK